MDCDSIIGIFVPGKVVDIDQDAITSAFVNSMKDADPIWPEFFKGRRYRFQDVNGEFWESIMFVTILNDKTEFCHQFKYRRNGTFVLVFRLDPKDKNSPTHAVYVDDIDEKNRRHPKAKCINSDPADPRPDIELSRTGNIFYKVHRDLSES